MRVGVCRERYFVASSHCVERSHGVTERYAEASTCGDMNISWLQKE